MSQRKGLSQILYLIIAASVLMMVALSLIFMFNDSVGGGTTDASACRAAVNTQCQVSGTENIEPPASCVSENAAGNKVLMNTVSGAAATGVSGYSGPASPIDCSEVS